MRAWWIAGVVVLLASLSPADAGKRTAKLDRKVIDPGDRWYCTSISDGAQRDSWCVREQAACEVIVDSLSEQYPASLAKNPAGFTLRGCWWR